MDRREFTKDTLRLLTGIALMNTISSYKLYAAKYSTHVEKWIKELAETCNDLKTNSLTVTQWQNKIEALHNAIGNEDISTLINFQQLSSQLHMPNLGVDTKRVVLPKVEGYNGRYQFVGKIFGMQKDRAIIPHGHKNMVSCHRVIKGNFLLRQYDRLDDDDKHMYIRQTIEEMVAPGTHSSISDERNNVHWLIAKSGPAYTFDVIVLDLHSKQTEIQNIDIDSAVKQKDDILRVNKMDMETALKQYGYDTHH